MATEFSPMTIVGTRPTIFKAASYYYRFPNSIDSRNSVFKDGTIPGQVIAHTPVDSKGSFYWVFNKTAKLNGTKIISEIDPTNNRYYVKHEKGLFNTEDLKTQGALTKDQVLAQVQADQEKDEKGVVVYYVERWGKPVLAIAALGIIAKVYIESRN